MNDTPEYGALQSPGIWVQRWKTEKKPLGFGLILDRDGVLVEEKQYLHRRGDVALLSEAKALLKWVGEKNIACAVTTNQSGIARGLISWADFLKVELEIQLQMKRESLAVDISIACPFHPDFTPNYTAEHARWRKPGPAMLSLACEILGFAPGNSWMIGDKITDIDAAKAAGLAGAFIWCTHQCQDLVFEAVALSSPEFSVVVADRAQGVIESLSSVWHI